MPYTAPVVDDLTTRFPELSEIDDALIGAVLAEAQDEVGGNWPDGPRFTATLYLAAHLLTVEGGADRSTERHLRGAVTSEKEGPVSVSYGPIGGGVVALQQGDDYTGTPYGRRYAELRRRTFAGMVFAV